MYVVVEESRGEHDAAYDIVGPWFSKSEAADFAKNFSEADTAYVAWLLPEED